MSTCRNHEFKSDRYAPPHSGPASSNRIPFGIKDGRLLHVDNVERGLGCDCVCPCCEAPLIARHGEKKIHHFAHANGANCEGAYETSLHLAAKEVLEEELQIVLPAVTAKLENGRAPIEFSPAKNHSIDSIALEKKLGATIPDVIATIAGNKLAIEIVVTHGVDEEKLSLIKREGVSTLAIDLSDLPRNLDKDSIRFYVVESVERKTWLYNAYGVARLAWLLKSGSHMPVEFHNMAMLVNDCPIPARVWHGKPYADVLDNCIYCEFNLHVGDDFIICNGAKKAKRGSSPVVPLKNSYGLDRCPRRPGDNYRF